MLISDQAALVHQMILASPMKTRCKVGVRRRPGLVGNDAVGEQQQR